ncbi:hypothetical protein [Ferrimonas senticii]|uniref:hypothetical protein n=1 Tax=Ferrimonas senticii TaxID=394566 RepID=UPI00040E8C2E|nr:hypothetical protein [Ferrimonas senticii]
MRLQGTLLEWNEQQGYGYVKPNGRSDKIYVDQKAFHYRPHRPNIGDTLILDVEQVGEELRATGAKFKLGRVAQVTTKKRSPIFLFLVLLLLALTAVIAYEFHLLDSNQQTSQIQSQ